MDEIIHEPRVYLIACSELNRLEIENFLEAELDGAVWNRSSSNGTELLAEFAGRVCYLSFGEKQGRKTTESYLRNIIEMQHGSVLEHSSWTFLISGVSRSFSHELVRHRAGFAFSQLSQRFVDESDTAFVVPPLIEESRKYDESCTMPSNIFWDWCEYIEHAREAYKHLVDELTHEMPELYPSHRYPNLTDLQRRKMVREAARSLLPNATETKMVFTANARALRHFIEYRGSEHADAEMRAVALRVLEIMSHECPAIFGDYSLMPGDTCTFAETQFVKV